MSTLLIIGSVWPEPNSSAAGRRMMQLISLFQSWDYEVTFASSAAKTDFMSDLQANGVDCREVAINSSTFDAFAKELQPEVVLFDRFMVEEQFGWRVAEVCPNAVRILDTEDLHSLRRCRKQAVKEGSIFHKKDLLAADVAKREIASIYRCDLSLIISEFEMELLQEVFKVDHSLIQYLPFLLKSVEQSTLQERPSYKERDHFVMIGNFRHPPNWDAVTYLRSDIWPLIRQKMPDAEVHIYGAYPSQKVWDIHKPEDGFFIEGRANNAEEVVEQARLSLAPLRFGAGLKGKLVESMRCGTPNVTTDIGAEGLAGNMEWAGSIANKAEEFAAEAIRLYKDQSAWDKAQWQGMRIINERFANKAFKSKLADTINEILENLDDHRKQNFIGSMLMHHSMASTRYMSKWIEEKNRS
ncbi:glycosyltransferase [Fodinibius salsisoli]|uniref:Glycosyltransferase family 4 protein n=1 Tax=Fodinibius salsisoli TaxID=2820877 RepID=A0ABT3PT95_9BACT|nr:glycosyltransferase [Fodinibius salsisoli]MCW9709089.1 glycosyltransferase family 4 protein [Fodinibius salsisoli]